MAWMRRLGCSHAVQGPITVDANMKPQFDERYIKYDWKEAVISARGLNSRSISLKILLYLQFTHPETLHTVTQQSLRQFRMELDGNFIFDGFLIEISENVANDEFLLFLQKLRDYFSDTQVDVEVTSKTIFESSEWLLKASVVVDSFYINLDKGIHPKNDTLFDEYRLLDPLLPDDTIPLEDTIKGVVEQMANISEPSRLIMSFSTITRGVIANNETNFDRGKDFLTETNSTLKVYEEPTGRFSLQEICEPALLVPVSTDNVTVSNYFLDRNQNWFSLNAPYNKATLTKIKWLSQVGVAGLALSEFSADDPDNECRYGRFPLHRFVSSNFDCKIPAAGRPQARRNLCGQFIPIL
ncbi:unnamed protein product [Bursaphelenchus okinawaensis]|uniref:Uncharacterized protein n=1 Tax=Bursaphelenchus okinawaensis TaxID=465554 RepID=A0A811JQ95_9BILA|nr:unnamed protein product [Bursaphelenchus okinawaensis]CAG9077470.1 unnamed protein product [Bursaphelenchus okinawaensis]